MEQIVERITEGLLQDLPDQSQFFTPHELFSSGAPHIVVETLRKNLLSVIESELKMPESEWVQTDHEQVNAAWQNFAETSRQHLRIPVSKLSYLLAEAVEQCLELALKPRQAVVEIIFRTRDTIDIETVKVRVNSLEVNKQLGLALLRYMEKKEKHEITIDQARDLVKKVDQRLVENYHPLNWAQALKPVFDLVGPSVDSDLFRIFFEDKEKPGYARKFDLLDEGLTETEFIEVLSSADVLDVDGYDDEQPELFVSVEEDADTEKVAEIEEPDDEKYADDEKVITSEDVEISSDEWDEEEHETDAEITDDLDDLVSEDEEEEEKPVEPFYFEQKQATGDDMLPEVDDYEEDISEDEDDQEENIVDLFSQIRNDNLFEEDQNEPVLTLVDDEEDSHNNKDNITLLSKFMFDESMEDDNPEVVEDEPEYSEQKQANSIYEEMNLVKEDHSDGQENGDFIEESPEEKEETGQELSIKIETEEQPNEIENEERTDTDRITEDSVEDEDDQPMWRSFLERDDLETDSGYEYEEEPQYEETDKFAEVEDDGFIEDPIYDLTTDQEEAGEKINEISGWLDDEKDRFIDEIFMGSEMAYEQALVEIMDYQNWKAASMYLEREVFSRNKIDVYDEAAVDFTDRLHSYFLEHNSKQDE